MQSRSGTLAVAAAMAACLVAVFNAPGVQGGYCVDLPTKKGSPFPEYMTKKSPDGDPYCKVCGSATFCKGDKCPQSHSKNVCSTCARGQPCLWNQKKCLSGEKSLCCRSDVKIGWKYDEMKNWGCDMRGVAVPMK